MRAWRPRGSFHRALHQVGRPTRSRWQIDRIDIRGPLLIVSVLGLLGGMSFAGGGLSFAARSSGTGGRITGIASVIDGDTIEVHGTRIRFDGIDAPESRQLCLKGATHVQCGREAAFHLSDRIGRRPVSCEPSGTDRYGRTLAICFEGGEDLNAMMVRDGQAVAYRHFSTRYVSEEDNARAASRGVWSTVFDMPFDWRQSH